MNSLVYSWMWVAGYECLQHDGFVFFEFLVLKAFHNFGGRHACLLLFALFYGKVEFTSAG